MIVGPFWLFLVLVGTFWLFLVLVGNFWVILVLSGLLLYFLVFVNDNFGQKYSLAALFFENV